MRNDYSIASVQPGAKALWGIEPNTQLQQEGLVMEQNRELFSQPRMQDLELFHKSRGRFMNSLNQLRLSTALNYACGKRVLDLGCGIGAFTLPLSRAATEVIAIDFSDAMLGKLLSRVDSDGIQNIRIVQADIRRLPLTLERLFDTVISFSTLYYIRDLGAVLSEMSRVLKIGGVAIFDLGSEASLNSFAMRADESGPKYWLLSQSAMLAEIAASGFQVVECRRFQLLPMWGRFPLPPPFRYLIPTGSSRIAREILGFEVCERMLDEWLCMIPILRQFAFRNLFVVRKA